MIIKPQISVIVPVYKVEAYLHRCVDSILAQTFTDFELILVDDGSPDNSGAICDEYAAKDKRIHVIHQENGGLSAARNAGIDWAFANSDSQWLSFIDSDDWVHPCFLEYLYRAVTESGTKVSACEFIRVENQEAVYPAISYFFQVRTWDQFYIENWSRGVVAWNKLYARDLFLGLRYPVGKINEDEFLTYKILDRAKQVAVINEALYFYFQNLEGIMKSNFSLNKLDALTALSEQCQFAKRNSYTALYNARVIDRIKRLKKTINDCTHCQGLGAKEKKYAVTFLRSETRKVLLAEGKRIAPLKDNQWLYEFAFPKTSWLYWTGKGMWKKLKRMVRKNANN